MHEKWTLFTQNDISFSNSNQNKWKFNGTKPVKYGEWDSISRPNSLIFPKIHLSQCSLALSCCRVTPFLLTITRQFSVKDLIKLFITKACTHNLLMFHNFKMNDSTNILQTDKTAFQECKLGSIILCLDRQFMVNNGNSYKKKPLSFAFCFYRGSTFYLQ